MLSDYRVLFFRKLIKKWGLVVKDTIWKSNRIIGDKILLTVGAVEIVIDDFCSGRIGIRE